MYKAKLSNWIFTDSDVSKNVNLEKILKYVLCYKKLGHIRTSSNYLNWLWKDVFTMIGQLEPPSYLQHVWIVGLLL
jgi:hypothetical protein